MAKNKNKQQQQQAAANAVAAVVPTVAAEVTGGSASASSTTTRDGSSLSQHQQEPDLVETGEEEEEELELLQLDLGDVIKMKQVLDESVAGALLENQQLPEDYVWDNWKLGIMFAACCFAMMAQFAPIPFPDSRPVLGVCGSLYFVLSGVLQLMASLVDRDTILWTRPVVAPDKKQSKQQQQQQSSDQDTPKKFKNKLLFQYGLKVRSDLPRFSEFYTVTIEFQLPKGDNQPPPAVQQTWSVGQFFDKEGYFDEVGLTMEVDKLFERFDQGKYDASDKAKKE